MCNYLVNLLMFKTKIGKILKPDTHFYFKKHFLKQNLSEKVLDKSLINLTLRNFAVVKSLEDTDGSRVASAFVDN